LLAVRSASQRMSAGGGGRILGSHEALDVVLQALGEAAQALDVVVELVSLLERRAVDFLGNALEGALRQA
jgi:isoaspartyl peptidase/L-asparaginase-like protein (Ntn-hydrolase superfamily)